MALGILEKIPIYPIFYLLKGDFKSSGFWSWKRWSLHFGVTTSLGLHEVKYLSGLHYCFIAYWFLIGDKGMLGVYRAYIPLFPTKNQHDYQYCS